MTAGCNVCSISTAAKLLTSFSKLAIADRAYLLQRGEVAWTGAAAELAARPDLLESGYLT